MDLGNIAPLLLPWTRDAWGELRPPVSAEAIRLSAELAGATYEMAVEKWLQAGWQDATIQVDGELTAVKNHESWLTTCFRRHRLQAKLHDHSALGQVLGTMRQREKSDTGKALVMLHPVGDGRYVVAVSFMGTGERLYDWISNFRMLSEDGVHQGFLQLTRQFEQNEDKIVFPRTAQEMGRRRLTLRDVLEDMTQPHSRFTLWLSGHSQGGALMQVWAHRKIHRDGVLPCHIRGYGFASPSVMTGLAVPNPAAYPLYHVQNSDDVVPRCGAQVHLGVCLFYPADDALRRRCYPWPMDELSVRARESAAPMVRRMTDSASCIEAAVAFLDVAARGGADEVGSLLGLSFPLRRMVSAADLDEMMRSARRHAAMAYQSMTGQPLDQARVADVIAEMEEAVSAVGLRAFSAAVQQLLRAPHSIAASLPEGRIGAYRYIAEQSVQRLIPVCWAAGNPPTRLVGVKPAHSGYVGSSGQAALNNRRRPPMPRRQHPNWRYRGRQARPDTRHHVQELERGVNRPGERVVRLKELGGDRKRKRRAPSDKG